MAIFEGRKIAIKFTQPLVGNVTGLNPPFGYKKSRISLYEAVVTTLNQYNSSYTGYKATDKDTATYWRGTTAVNWITIQLPKAKIVTQLRLYLSSYYIKTFKFSGSNDGETWAQIGGEYTAASSTTAQWYTFDLENSVEYLYYRLDTLTAYSSRVYLYELELYEDVPIGNESKFTVSFDQYSYVPDGIASKVNRPVTHIDVIDANTIVLNFDSGNTRSIQRAIEAVTVSYDGSGTLRGQGGPVLAFEKTFIPVGLDPKNDPNDSEHLEVTSLDMDAEFITVYYKALQSQDENVSLTGVEFECLLTHVDDI